MKSVDERQRVGLQAQARGDQTDRPARCSWQSIGFSIKAGGELMYRRIGDPLAALDMKSEQIGVHAFADGDEVSHHGNANLATEQTHDVEESRERQNGLRL
jgi:hypothetical protein